MTVLRAPAGEGGQTTPGKIASVGKALKVQPPAEALIALYRPELANLQDNKIRRSRLRGSRRG